MFSRDLKKFIFSKLAARNHFESIRLQVATRIFAHETPNPSSILAAAADVLRKQPALLFLTRSVRRCIKNANVLQHVVRNGLRDHY